jgi:uracil-DNA glycosylase
MTRPSDIIHESFSFLKALLNEPELVELRQRTADKIVYPERQNIFRVFSQKLSDINVVILGQDPYHGFKQANGLSFAVQPHIPIPPSLRIIQKELQLSCIGTEWQKEFEERKNTLTWKSLHHWEKQGVFLLNTALTVEQGLPGSHLKEWRRFTEIAIQNISRKNNVIWLLWGKPAQSFLPHIYNPFFVDSYTEETIKEIPTGNFNYVFCLPHPASEIYRPGSGFIGSNQFKFANEILFKQKKQLIYW